ncbi:MAG: glycosyltransferase family 2 protein [Opitutaceae bacterium]|nr:glycosyltransferase family 2 protein [Opitutaceae bacterium]
MLVPASVQVVIPALNEEATIAAVVTGLRSLGVERVRVVDNGSTDDTPARARAAGAEVISEPKRGYGQACWTGTRQLDTEVEWILFCDADGSDELADLPRLFAEAAAGADLVLGDRRARPDARAVMTPVQNFGNALSVSLIRLGWGHRYHDLGPLRLIRRSLYERIGMRDRGFGWTIEMQVRAVELGARIVELPVAYHPRKGGRSKISGTIKGSVQAGTIILSTLALLSWRRVPRRPQDFGRVGFARRPAVVSARQRHRRRCSLVFLCRRLGRDRLPADVASGPS